MKSFVVAAGAAVGLLLAGCTKYEGPTTASGTVVDKHTGRVVAGAYVAVGSVQGGQSGGGTGTLPTSTRADADGRFALSFEAAKGQQYTLFASTPSGYHSSYGDCPLLDGGRRNDNLQIKADAPAWVRINCVDDPPSSKITLHTQGYYGDDTQQLGPGNYSFVRPVQSYTTNGSILWGILDSQGQRTQGNVYYTSAGFDTTAVTIHF